MVPNSSFYQLTPDQIFTSLEDAGYKTSGHCLALNSLENRVYRIGIEDGSAVVAKFYRPGRWNLDQIREEHQFLFELIENEIPVIAPLQFPDGDTVRTTLGDIHFSIWPLHNGRIVEEIKETDLPVLGRWLGRLHNIGSSKPSNSRTQLDVEAYGMPSLQLILNSDWMAASMAKRYELASKKIFQQFIEKSKNIKFQRIHGDCHKGNLLINEHGFSFLDFDDFMTGPTVQDLWMLLPFGDSKAENDRDLFLSGYREFREFNVSAFDLIEPLRGIRFIYYSAWIAKRWDDPSFPNAFPNFGTEEFWEKEVRDLEILSSDFPKENYFENQEVGIDEGDSNASLTNKDLFWDWEE
ncbi:serine/threonine protein kinase [Leptospira sp. GIMC2001]|nr:serine/threonine protein kinase [Leptospira sp. GIMC2001]WCL49803.1 serine/threonine protein kinase [Leptospira sp. GIMC2001]